MANPIDSLRKRKALHSRPAPYRHRIKPKHFLGYRRNQDLPSSRWVAIADRRMHSLGVEGDMDYPQALEAALHWFAMVGDGDAAGTLTVGDAIRRYVDHLRIEGKNADRYGKRLDTATTESLRQTRLADLKQAQVKAFRDSKVKTAGDAETIRRSKATANRALKMIKAALNRAYKDQLVSSKSAWEGVELFRNVERGQSLYLTPEQVRALLRASSGAFRELVEMAVLTGARYGELAAARVRDFDATDGKVRLSGKTGERICYLSDQAVAALKRISRDRLPAAPLLMREDGTAWKTDQQVRLFREAAKTAKLPPSAVFYSLRHYHISRVLIAGVYIQVIAENVGTSIGMIERNYGKFLKTDRRAMFNAVSLGI